MHVRAREVFERNSNRVISKPVTFSGLIRIESVFYEIYLVFVYIVCTPHFLLGGGGGLRLLPTFRKGGGLTGSDSFERGLLGKRGWIFSGGGVAVFS